MNRCSRCGCFFIGNDTVCYNCVPYDNNDRAKLTDFCQGNEEVTYENILYKTGIAPSNLSRFLEMPDYAKIAKIVDKKGVEFYE